MERPIVQLGDEHLRIISAPIPENEFESEYTKKIIQDMKDSLDSVSDGIAISAPQIGENVRIFVVSPKIFDEEYMDNKKRSWDKSLPYLVAINPVIEKTSKDTVIMEEGCLSIKGVFGKVGRPSKVTMSAYDEFGNAYTRGAGGLLARVFQHEIDHLDGILFIDKAESTYPLNEQ